MVARTDADGVARIILAPDKDCKNDTEDAIASYKISATCASKDDVSTKLTFKVGAISYSAEDNINNSVKEVTDKAKKKVGDNATNREAYTANMVSKSQDYVSSQQVSTVGEENHAITFSSGVSITLPSAEGESEPAKQYVQKVDKKSGEYMTYAETSVSIDFDIKDFSNVEYATVYFNSIKLSQYSQMYVLPYYYKWGEKKEESALATTPTSSLKAYGNDIASYSASNQGLQIAKSDLKCLQSDTGYYEGITIKIKSVGQVNVDNNGGFDVKDITYVYNTNTKTTTTTKMLSSASIKWETVTPVYSTESTLSSADNIINYSTVVNTADGETATYSLPVFPYVGNAIITVYDSNKKPVRYYAAPTVNDSGFVTATTGGAISYKNRNIIGQYGWDGGVSPVEAYLITSDEKTASVGELKQDGNKVIVNSTKSGTTFLRGTLTSTDESIKLDAKNSEVYTYVMWNPIANVSDRNGFLALEGQKVKVVAQLYDKNGNKATENGVSVNFYDEKGEITNGTGNYGNNYTGYGYTADDKGRATVVNITNGGKTNANGQVELILQGTGAVDMLGISAKTSSSKYNVALVLNDTSVTTADVYWLLAGLEYQAKLDYDKWTDSIVYKDSTVHPGDWKPCFNPNSPYVSTVYSEAFAYDTVADTTDEIPYFEAVNGISTVNAALQKYNPKEKWNIAAQVDSYGVLKGGAFKDFHIGINSGATIGAKSANDFRGTITTNTGVNGMVSIYSDVADDGAIDFSLDKGSFKDVEFYHMNASWGDWATCKSVGYDDTTVSEKLTVPFTVGTKGTMLASCTPMGTKVIGNSVVAYVRVTDSFGNPLEGAKKVGVKFTTTTSGAALGAVSGAALGAEYNVVATDINEDGIAAVKIEMPTAGNVILKAEALNIAGTAVDTAISPVTTTYEFSSSATTALAIIRDSVKYTKNTIEFKLNKDIVSSSVVADLFTIQYTPEGGSAATYTKSIDKVVVEGKKVTITLKYDISNISDGGLLDVTINAAECSAEKADGIKYIMTATDGESIADGKGFTYSIASGATVK